MSEFTHRASHVKNSGFVEKSANGIQLKDNRPQAVLQKKQVETLAGESAERRVIQQKANHTGLPDQLKSGVENLSGLSMDDVKVHYNSSQPAQLSAHAYAQGTEVHIAPGQEKHLPHEAWHVVQQKEGRVKPTMQMRGKVNVNDNAALEKEADVMGEKARRGTVGKSNTSHQLKPIEIDTDTGVIQAFRLGDVLAIAGGAAGAIGGALYAGPLGAVAGAGAGAYAGDKVRKQINDFRNRNSGYTVTVMTSGGIIRDLVGKHKAVTGGVRQQGSAGGVVKSALGTLGLVTGHVSVQLEGPAGIETYEMGGGGVQKINNVSGSTRETHNITQQQYNKMKVKIAADTGRITHTFFDLNSLRRIIGTQNANLASCAGWVISLLEDANVSPGTLFDRYIFPIPKIMAQSGWDRTLQMPLEMADDSANKLE